MLMRPPPPSPVFPLICLHLKFADEVNPGSISREASWRWVFGAGEQLASFKLAGKHNVVFRCSRSVFKPSGTICFLMMQHGVGADGF